MDDCITNPPLKRCSKGDNCVHPMGCWQPATQDHFALSKERRDGFQIRCKACANAHARRYREQNRGAISERSRRWRAENVDRVREYRHDYYLEHKDEVLSRIRRYQTQNPEETRARRRRYYEKSRGIHVRWSAKNPEKHRARNRRWRAENREWVHKYDRHYRENNPEFGRVSGHRYRARKRNLPDEFTVYDWQRALDYFNGCCAVCGRQLRDLFATHTAAADHWIPLTDSRCLGTIPTNIVPLCHGIGGCNNRKRNRDPIEFLETEFGKRRAGEILKRINAYFEWIKQQS